MYCSVAPYISYSCTPPVPQFYIEGLEAAVLFSICIFKALLFYDYIKYKTPLKFILCCQINLFLLRISLFTYLLKTLVHCLLLYVDIFSYLEQIYRLCVEKNYNI